MADRLVHIVDDAEVLSDAGDLTLVCVLTGFLDAGKAAELAASHLAAQSDGKVVATFDVDSLHDYRARRPPVTFLRDHYADYEAPRLAVRAMRDTGGTPFLLLVGPEPDIRWEAFARAVREVVGARLGVLALGLAERGAHAVDEDDLTLWTGHWLLPSGVGVSHGKDCRIADRLPLGNKTCPDARVCVGSLVGSH